MAKRHVVAVEVADSNSAGPSMYYIRLRSQDNGYLAVPCAGIFIECYSHYGIFAIGAGAFVDSIYDILGDDFKLTADTRDRPDDPHLLVQVGRSRTAEDNLKGFKK